MSVTVQIMADSVNQDGARITTVACTYPRIIHAHVLTHRAFSRNAASSRAIPTRKFIADLLANGYIPEMVGQNRTGMQAGPPLTGFRAWACSFLWRCQMLVAIGFALVYAKLLKVHKEIANRPLEAFAHTTVLITATEWDNFFQQRIEGGAQGETEALALAIKTALANSTPRPLLWGEWHIPFDDAEAGSLELRLKRATARCARVSYKAQDGDSGLQKDLALYRRLLGDNESKKAHPSPFEHCAEAVPGRWANFSGFRSFRFQLGI